MKNILITGGAGFIGSNLTKKLVEKEYVVTILDNLSEQIHGNYLESALYNSVKDISNFIKGDVRNKLRIGKRHYKGKMQSFIWQQKRGLDNPCMIQKNIIM